MLDTVYGIEALSYTHIFEWFIRCRERYENHEDDLKAVTGMWKSVETDHIITYTSYIKTIC